MWARVARFEGDPGDIDARIEKLRPALDSGDLPFDLASAKFLLLVDRESGGMLGVTLFESEDALRKGDEAMNAGPGNAGGRASVDFYEVPLHISSGVCETRRVGPSGAVASLGVVRVARDSSGVRPRLCVPFE